MNQEAKTKRQFIQHSFRKATVPTAMEEVSRRGWVKWGVDNLYPQFLWYLYYQSPIHGGIINSKLNYISSGGINYSTPGPDWDTIYDNGRSRYNLDEVSQFYFLDDLVAELYYILAKKDVTTGVWYLDPMDFELIRPSEDGNLFYYSENWATDNQGPKTNYREIPSIYNLSADDTECLLQVKTKSRQQLVRDKKKVMGGFFSMPKYVGAIDSIMTDIEINYYRYSEVVNGYKGGTILSMNDGKPEEGEAENIVRDMKIDATDRDSQGGLIVIFTDGAENAPTVEQLNGNDLDKRYESTETGLLKKIMIGHSVTNPKLFGVMSENVMSETDDTSSYERYQKIEGTPRRKGVADSMTYVLQRLNGMEGEISFNVPTLSIEQEISESKQTLDALNSMNPIVATKVLDNLTRNEIRALAGAIPLPGGEVVPDSGAAQFAARSVIEYFKFYGQPRKGTTFIHSRPHKSFDADDEKEYMNLFFSERFDGMTKEQTEIVRALIDGKSLKQIEKELVISAKDLAEEITTLRDLGYVAEKSLKPTQKAQAEIVNTDTIEVVYTYEERPDAPPLKGMSREFCTEMIKINRVYTRAEINQISQAVGRDVWRYRGGWYHDPETGRNQPSCRHYWKQNLIVKRA